MPKPKKPQLSEVRLKVVDESLQALRQIAAYQVTLTGALLTIIRDILEKDADAELANRFDLTDPDTAETLYSNRNQNAATGHKDVKDAIDQLHGITPQTKPSKTPTVKRKGVKRANAKPL